MNGPYEPKVTVVVPFHNAARFLHAALDSIASSSHRNIEVCLVDDNSTDDGCALAKRFADQDDRFMVIQNTAHRGVSFSRNRGMEAATGAYVLFVDADDWISPDWIDGLVRNAVARDADVVIGRTRQIRGGRESDYRMKGLKRPGELAFQSMVFRDNAAVWNKIYAASLMQNGRLRFEEGISIGEDLLFTYQALAAARRIYYGASGFYYHNFDNVSSAINRSTAEARIKDLSRVLGLLLEDAETREVVNRTVWTQVAREILLDHYRFLLRPLDAVTLQRIRRVDRLVEYRVRLKLLGKKLRRPRLAGSACLW